MKQKYIGDVTIGEWWYLCTTRNKCIDCPLFNFCAQIFDNTTTLYKINLAEIGSVTIPDIEGD